MVRFNQKKRQMNGLHFIQKINIRMLDIIFF